jgi:hypothetical protein
VCTIVNGLTAFADCFARPRAAWSLLPGASAARSPCWHGSPGLPGPVLRQVSEALSPPPLMSFRDRLTDRSPKKPRVNPLTDCPKKRAPWRREIMKRPFSLISTAFLSSRRQSFNGGRFSCFIGGAIVNVPVFGRQEGLPLDANSSGGSVGRSLGKTHPKNQTIGSPYLLT